MRVRTRPACGTATIAAAMTQRPEPGVAAAPTLLAHRSPGPRIGVVADTHVGDELPALPGAVTDALAGVDLVLHAGDLCDASVLPALEAVAPVLAVRGNHERGAGAAALPDAIVIEAEGWRIGLTHGIRPRAVEVASSLLFSATGRLRMREHCRAVGRRFGAPNAVGAVDAVVFGHLHLPVHVVIDGVLFFSPGAVYQPELDPVFDWSGAERRVFRRVRRRLPAAARQPAVGILEAGPAALRARIVPLAGMLRP